MSHAYHAAGASYLPIDQAQALLDVLPGCDALRAADPDMRAAALALATLDVDTAMPYQGTRFDPDQTLQFPRRVDSRTWKTDASTVQDWDEASGQAVIPNDVKLATLHQADSILSGVREPRIAAQHDGVVYEQTAGDATSYKSTPGPGVPSGLCRRAYMLMRAYRIRSGAID